MGGNAPGRSESPPFGGSTCYPFPEAIPARGRMTDQLTPPPTGGGLAERERRLAQMLAILREPLCVIDREFRFLYANPAAAEYMGRAVPQILGRRMGDLFPQLAGSPLEEQLLRARDMGQEARFEIESRLHPGTWYQVLVSPSDEGLILYYRDVTSRHLDARALATIERLMRVAQGMAHVGNWIVEGPQDLTTATVTWSEETFRIFGYEPGEVRPTIATLFEHVHPEDRGRVAGAVGDALRQGAPYEVEHRLIRKDGSPRVLHQWGVVEWGANRQPLRVLGACQDVTEARAREAEVLEAREQLQFVTDTMAAQVAHCSRDMRYVWVSRAYAAARGYGPEQLSGRKISEILGEQVFASIQPHIERALRGERFSYEQQVDYLDRGPTWVEAHYDPTFDADGRPDGWVGVVVDIDARRRAEEALRDADRRKDDFLALLAHELRNPLAPIRNSVHLLALTAPHDPRLAKACDTIERQVAHMARLLDDLLDVSRITRGKVLLSQETLDLGANVRATAEDLRGLLEAQGLGLAVSLPAEPLPVTGDPTRLAQIVGNLLQNAKKFSDPGGHVTVSARRAEDGAVLVTVADDGIGIPPEMLPRLFEPFSQADSGLGRRGGGLGLGLALVRQLAELHGGSVEAASAGRGHGSTFTVRLPLATAPGSATPRAAPRPARRPRRVLVVEDNVDGAESVRLLLEAFGHQVVVAHTGADALDAARTARPEIVLCDIGLPGAMDGYAVGRALRGEAGSRVRLVALSGYGQREDKARALAAGFDRHVTKPLDPAQLDVLLDELP